MGNFSVSPTWVFPVEEKYKVITTPAESYKKEYYLLSTTPNRRWRFMFDKVSDATFNTILDHWRGVSGPYDAFYLRFPIYINTDVTSGTTTSMNISSELVTGGGFEDAGDISEWTAVSNAQLSSVANGQAGNYLQLQDNGVTANPSCRQDTSTSLVAGRVYRFTFYVKQGTEATYRASIRDPDGVTDYGKTSDTEATAEWVQHSYVFEANQSGTARVYLHRRGAAAGTNVLFDTVSLYEQQVDVYGRWAAPPKWKPNARSWDVELLFEKDV